MFGVGSRVGVSADAPSCDMVYKMVSYDGRPVMKLSEGKESLPAAKQVFRQHGSDGMMSSDVIGLSTETPSSRRTSCWFRQCRTAVAVIPPIEISDARQRVADGLSRLPQERTANSASRIISRYQSARISRAWSPRPAAS